MEGSEVTWQTLAFAEDQSLQPMNLESFEWEVPGKRKWLCEEAE